MIHLKKEEVPEHVFSYRALGRIVLVGFGLFLISKSISVIAMIIISLVLAAAIVPLVSRFGRRLPKPLVIFGVILMLLVPIAALVVTTVITLNNQSGQVAALVAPFFEKLHITKDFFTGTGILEYLQAHASYLLSSTQGIILGVLSVLTVIFLTFYFVLDHERLFGLFLDIFPTDERSRIEGAMTSIAEVTGQYIRGNLLISLICIVIIFIGLTLLKIPFALPIAIFAGIIDLLPVIGPIVSAIPAAFLGFAMSPLTGLLVIVLYLAYSQFENAVIGPWIYTKRLDLSSALIFLSIVIGGSVAGILGAFLALPVAASIPVLINYQRDYRSRHLEE